MGRFPYAKLLLSTLLITASGVNGALYESLEDLPRKSYDFVVVGGGTAGNVIANRLTENPNVTVLVLEAGNGYTDVEPMIPRLCTSITPFTKYDWNYTTTNQAGLDNRQIPMARGFLLGGSSSVNYMVYSRGPKDDWDRYAALTGDKGWSWDAMQPYFRKNEHFIFPKDDQNITTKVNPEVHSTRGPTLVSLPSFTWPTDELILQTTRELGDEFPFNVEPNDGTPLGVGYSVFTIGNGTRSSSAVSYLAPNYLRRRNLDVLLHAQASRVLTSSKSRKLTFNTVEFATRSTGTTLHKITAKKEIVLSAGTIGTTQVLLNSGIGDASDLRKLNITPLVNLPSVGRNLTDHPIAAVPYFVNSTDTWDVLNNNTFVNEQIEVWKDTRSGIMASTITEFIAFLRLPNNSSIFQQAADPASGPTAGHYEFVFSNGYVGPPPAPQGNFFTMSLVVVTPSSRGTITLSSNDPFAPPNINPNYFSTEFDRFTMREAFRAGRRFLAAPAWSEWITRPMQLEGNPSDEEIDAYIRQSTVSIYHPVGTAAMSHSKASYGVVDPDLRVKGVDGLRIVDASVFPYIPSGVPQIPVYAIAERASDIIKAQHRV